MFEDLAAIKHIKAELGDDLVVLAHHYQRKEVVECGDFIGDSYVLAKEAATSSARRIVFCGVHFMAESARILAQPGQRVYMPDTRAGCPMADMADETDAMTAFQRIVEVTGRKVVPVTYVNSTADVKAFVGREGGLTCTSSNAAEAFKWARRQGDVIFFLPDEFLGVNTARRQSDEEIVVWNPHQPNGGLEDDALARAGVVLWKGYCHVHTYFTPEMVTLQRERYKGCKVVVHPECKPEVVDAADADGSTAFIVQVVKDAAPGDTIVIGTEVNLVLRLARDFPTKTVVPLSHSVCPNMYRTTVAKLRNVLETFDPYLEIKVAEETAADARLALERMLELPR